MTPGQWQNFQDFMARLDQAICAQRSVVDGNCRDTSEGQQAWLQQKNRLRAFDTLADRHFEQQRVLEGRREQKLSDEGSARRLLGDMPGD
jgi:flagellar FliJ protein